jgi:hypothetical protein
VIELPNSWFTTRQASGDGEDYRERGYGAQFGNIIGNGRGYGITFVPNIDKGSGDGFGRYPCFLVIRDRS